MPFRTRLPTVAAALLAAACASKEPAPGGPTTNADTQPAAGAQATSATTPWVKARDTTGIALLEAPAQVLAAPESTAAVSAPFPARVVRVHVRAGESVTKGQALCDVVMPEVVRAAGNYASATTRVDAYDRRRTQLEGLRRDGLVKLTEFLDVETKLAESRAEQQSALALLRAADLAADDAQRILAGRSTVALRSPIDGVVTHVRASLGETRDAGGEPIVRVAGQGAARVEARLSRALPVAARYQLVTSAGARHDVKLLGRAPHVDARDGTTLAWFDPPAGADLPQGSSGRVEVRLDDETMVSAVPARAVALASEGPFVVVNRDGKPQRAQVEVLASSGADALVRGVAPGTEVAADAAAADPAAPERGE